MNAAPPALDFVRLRGRLPRQAATRVLGRVRRVVGQAVEAEGVVGELGDLCLVQGPHRTIPLEIVGFEQDVTTLLPLERLDGIGPRAEIESLGRPLTVPVGTALLGRVLDGLGRPLDDGGPLDTVEPRPVTAAPPPVLDRPPIDSPLRTGVRSIDLLHTIGRGQRLGIFSGSGVGKSNLVGMILRESNAEVKVLALIGERGREVRHFLDEHLRAECRERTVVIAATSDRPALQRITGTQLAATVAEFFRDQGHDVLFVMDSATRYAMALREAGLAAGEPPTTRGYPPSLFSQLPRLVERFGTSRTGSITALLTVLVEGDDLNDPAADTLRGLLDGHIILSRALAERGHYPPVDPLKSLSRLMEALVDDEHRQAAKTLRAWLALHEEHRDLIEVGVYRRGSHPELDRVLERLPAIETLLRQELHEHACYETARQQLLELTREAAP